MKIDALEVFLVRLPLKKVQRVADRPVEHFDTVYVRLVSQGVSGWGEAAPGNQPYLTDQWSGGVYRALVECLAPLLEDASGIESGDRLAEILAPVRGNRQGKAALDMAWHDLAARQKSEPLWKTLGGRLRPLEVGLTFDRCADHEEFYAELERAAAERFHRISLKMRPGWEVQAVKAARDMCPWPTMIEADVEGALSFDRHGDLFFRLQDFLPALIEQPIHPSDFVGHAMLQDALRVPIALDESICSAEEARIASDLKSCKVFCLKAGRVGGLTEAKKIHDIARSCDMHCYGGVDLISSVGYRHQIALSSLEGFTYPCDFIRFDEIFAEEPGLPIVPSLSVVPKEESENSTNPQSFPCVNLWNESGIGFEPNKEVIRKYAIAQYEMEK